VNMGGDVRVRGASPTGDGWTLAIEHPWCAAPIALIGLWEGAVATSSVLRRVWTVGGQRRHHLIDPATEKSSDSDLAFASVIAGDAWKAEVLAKAVLLRGSLRAFDLLDETMAALTVSHDGTVRYNTPFASFLGGVALPDRLEFDQEKDHR
jgi:FAD:protein FMN transferase